MHYSLFLSSLYFLLYWCSNTPIHTHSYTHTISSCVSHLPHGHQGGNPGLRMWETLGELLFSELITLGATNVATRVEREAEGAQTFYSLYVWNSVENRMKQRALEVSSHYTLTQSSKGTEEQWGVEDMPKASQISRQKLVNKSDDGEKSHFFFQLVRVKVNVSYPERDIQNPLPKSLGESQRN